MKICKKCGIEKSLDSFYKHKLSKDGAQHICKLCKKEEDFIYYQNNKDHLQNINKNWSKKNKERRKESDENWRKNNKDKIKEINKKYRKNNPHYKIRNIFHNLKNKNFNIISEKTQLFIIKDHIENQFTEEMNWSNIEIDHKIPVTWFKNETSSDIINNLNNLQPLYINDNRTKFNKTSSPITLNFYIIVKQHIKEKYIERIHIENKIN
jgi:hypothetical protein